MSKSIISNEKECYYCRTTLGLQRHHILYGSANRKQSEAYGCWVWLCYRHHTGGGGVHFNPIMDLELKQMCQRKFEETHTREEFMRIFGRSWL